MPRPLSGLGRHARHALLCALALQCSAAHAACPPLADDGIAVRKGEMTLAWRPFLAGDTPIPGNRIPLAKHFSLDVQLCGPAGVSPAQLTRADATMPAHRHGMNYRPVIKALGNGRFRVDGMMFHMAGGWQLAFEVLSGKEILRLSHDVQVD